MAIIKSFDEIKIEHPPDQAHIDIGGDNGQNLDRKIIKVCSADNIGGDVFLSTIIDPGDTETSDGSRIKSEAPDVKGNKRIMLFRRSVSSRSDDNFDPLMGDDISYTNVFDTTVDENTLTLPVIKDYRVQEERFDDNELKSLTPKVEDGTVCEKREENK